MPLPHLSINAEQAALRIHGVGCIRADRELIRDLNQELRAGQGLHVTGANGSGKTTLLRIIAGLSSDYSGEVRWGDSTIRHNPAALREQLLYIGHRPGVKAALTPLENLQWWHSLFATGLAVSTATFYNSLAAFGLAAHLDTPCARLSAGQQRRVALARLAFSAHALWVLDEPFTALDQAGIEQLEKLFAKHLQRDGLLVLSTHQPLHNSALLELDLDRALAQSLAASCAHLSAAGDA